MGGVVHLSFTCLLAGGVALQWDRLPFITTSTSDGDVLEAQKGSTDVLVTNMTHNFVISNYASTWPLDHDDGSCFYHDKRNFLIWAGAKNFLGENKVTAENIYVNVEANGMGVCAVDDSAWKILGWHADGYPGNADIFSNNTCITASGDMYHYSKCDPENIPDTTDRSFGNTFISPGEVSFTCGSKNYTLNSFQAAGYEESSTHQTAMPSAAAISEMGARLLSIEQ